MSDISGKDLAYRALASAIGGPVDLTTMVMRPFGYKVENPILGSEWIGQKMERGGLISNARDPLKEFTASIMVPSPGGATAAASKLSMLPAIAGMARYTNPISAFHGTTRVFDEFSNVPKSKNPDYYYDSDVATMNKLGPHFGSSASADDILTAKFITSPSDADLKLLKEFRKNFPDVQVYPVGANIRPVELGLKNTYELGAESNFWKLLNEAGIPPDSRAAASVKARKIRDYLAKQGYDGIEYLNEFEDVGSKSFIVFDVAKIKPKFSQQASD